MKLCLCLLVAVALFAQGCATTGWPKGPYAGGTPGAQAVGHAIASVVHTRNGRFDQAASELETASQLAPDSRHLRVELIQAYNRMGDTTRALKATQAGIDRMPDDVTFWMIRGLLNQKQGEYDAALTAFNRAVALQPDNDFGYDALVQAAEEANDLVSTLDIYKRLVELKPDHAVFHYQLGYTLARINDQEPARDAIERALELNPELLPAQYLLGLLYLDLDEDEKAAEVFRGYLVQRPDDESARERLAASLARLGRFDEALATLAVEGEPGTGRRYLQTVYLLLRLDQPREAAALIPPNDAPIVGTAMRALAHKLAGDPYRKPLDTLDQVDGDIDAESRDILANTIFLFGSEEAAPFFAGALRELVDEGVPSETLRVLLGRTLITADKNDEAEKVLLETLALFPSAEGASRHGKWIHLYLATLYDDQDNFASAEHHLKKCIEADPTDPEVLNFLGYLYAEEGVNLEEAEKLLLQALEQEPDSGFYLDSLGWVYYKMGDAERAVELIRRAIVNMTVDDAVLRDHLGDAYLMLGETDKAVAEWERAIRLDSELEGVREKLDRHRPSETK